MKPFITIKFLAVAGMIALLGSCKPDTDLLLGHPDMYSGVYMPQAVNRPAVYNFNVSSQPDTIIYGADFGGPELPSADISVQFEADPSLVATYNADNLTSYPVLPEGAYKLEQTNSIIPAGKSGTPPLKLSIYTDKLDGVGGYLLPVTLKAEGVKDSLKITYFLISAAYTSNPFPDIDRSNWQIIDFSSEETVGESAANGGHAIHALDGDVKTFWTTQWKNAKPGPPHYITLDLQNEQKIHGIKITARTDANGEPVSSGNPKDIIVQTSTDGINWSYSEPFALTNIVESTVYLAYAQNARYIKITINSSQADKYLTNIAELNAF